MDSPVALLKFLAPQIPSLSYAAAQHTLGFSPTSSKWDLRTELTVKVLREMMSMDGRKRAPRISKIQASTVKAPEVKGKTWVANAVISKPPTTDEEGKEGVSGLRQAVFKAIDDMAKEQGTYTKPDLVDIEVEWTGYRPSAAKDEPLPSISEEERYSRMMTEPSRSSEVTFLYFHGGAYYLADPRSHRALASRLAKESHGRVCNVRYRLAPQTAFPGQLLDAFQVYLSLLYPPPGSMHAAVPADKIVFAGDSAGGNLSFALLQLLLQLHRASSGVPLVHFHGIDVHVPLPAGVSANSGWFDISRSMPSLLTHTKYDYLPSPNHDNAVAQFSTEDPGFWPADPPRGDIFTDLSLLDHPLVSVLMAESWENSPPMWFCTGEEMLSDEDKVVAKRAAQQGVKVTWEEYEAMPHVFALLMPTLDGARRCVQGWAQWARKVADGEGKEEKGSKGAFIEAKTGKEKAVDVLGIEVVEFEEAKRLVAESKAKRLKGWERTGKGGGVKATL